MNAQESHILRIIFKLQIRTPYTLKRKPTNFFPLLHHIEHTKHFQNRKKHIIKRFENSDFPAEIIKTALDATVEKSYPRQ